jgi:site-specific recombinase XerD
MKIYSNLTINYWLRTPKNSKDANFKNIYCRLIVNNKRADISTNLKINSKDWCSISERVKQKNGQESSYNSFLDEMRNQLIETYNLLKQLNKLITTSNIKNLYLDKNSLITSLNSTKTIKYLIDKFLESVTIQYESKIISESTRRAYLCTSKTFRTFLPTVGLSIDSTPDELTRITFMEFERHLILVRKQNSNSAYRVIKQLRRIFNFSYENDLISNRIEIKSNLRYRNPERKFLTLEEVQLLEKFEFDDIIYEEVRDVFIFSIYTGFAFNELYRMKHNNIREINGRIWVTISRQKTGNEQKVPLLPIPIRIIKKYESHPKCSKNQKLLPIRCNKEYNRLLKEIQTLTGIQTKLTTHIGRHTFATTIALCNGLSIETLSKILSHTSIKVTQLYAKVVDSKVIEDFDKLNSALNTRVNRGEVHLGA